MISVIQPGNNFFQKGIILAIREAYLEWIRCYVWYFNSVSKMEVTNPIGAEQEILEIFNPFNGSDVLGKLRQVRICLSQELNKRLPLNIEGLEDLRVVHVGRISVAENCTVVAESERSNIEAESALCRYNAWWNWINTRNHTNLARLSL